MVIFFNIIVFINYGDIRMLVTEYAEIGPYTNVLVTEIKNRPYYLPVKTGNGADSYIDFLLLLDH